jgi:ubiquinone/menaquinone biosynthesis C-methylase UbiE
MPDSPTVKPEPRRHEENPFEDPTVAALWVKSVEGEVEGGHLRDKYVYPLIREWLNDPAVESVLDLGAGQGAAVTTTEGKRYVGLEPSQPLVDRAREQYPDKEFVVGNAYELPFKDGSFDAAFSINVWFHLEDLLTASRELARVLKPGGKFLIISANPDAYDTWRSFYKNVKEDDKKFIGAAEIPLVTLPRNVFYKHTQQEILGAFKNAGLVVEEAKPFAPIEVPTKVDLFAYYRGGKAT